MASRPTDITPEQLPGRLQPVILGADYSAYAYTRAFREAYGAKPIIMGSDDIKSISRTRFAEYRHIPGMDSEDMLMEILPKLGEELCAAGKVPFLATCGDFYARIVSSHKAELEQWFYTPVVDFDVLDFVSQKKNFYDTCEKIGLGYPKTRFLDCSVTGQAADDEGFRYPLVAKPSNSAAWHYVEFEGKKKVFLIKDRAELDYVYGELQKSCYNESLIIQEYIGGGDDNLHVVYAYADKDSNPVFTVCGHVGLEDHMPGAIGNAVIIAGEENPELAQAAARFMKEVGYRGMGTFDVKRDPADGSYRFLEMNTRPGRSSWIVLLAGINFARMQVEQVVCGIEPVPVKPATDWTYAAVPVKVAERYMPEGAFKQQVLAAYKAKKTSFALDIPDDDPLQRLWAWVHFYHQVKKYEKFFPQGEGI